MQFALTGNPVILTAPDWLEDELHVRMTECQATNEWG